MKYFQINLTKYMQDLFVENCKFPMNEIKEVNKWRAISMFLIRDSILSRCQFFQSFNKLSAIHAFSYTFYVC